MASCFHLEYQSEMNGVEKHTFLRRLDFDFPKHEVSYNVKKSLKVSKYDSYYSLILYLRGQKEKGCKKIQFLKLSCSLTVEVQHHFIVDAYPIAFKRITTLKSLIETK